MTPEPIILIGGGGHCRSCIDVIEADGRFRIIGVVDRADAIGAEGVLGYPFLGTDGDLSRLRADCSNALVTVGQIRSPEARVRLYEDLKALGFTLPVIISPHAIVSAHASLEEGTIVMHGSIVNAGAAVGKNCILNTKSLVEHDAVIGDHCHVSTAAVVNGGCRIGRGSFIGSNSVCVHGIELPDGSFVRAGKLEKGT